MILNIISRYTICGSISLLKPSVGRLSSLFPKTFRNSAILNINDDHDNEMKKGYLRSLINNIKNAPLPALVYCTSGLIPFIGLPALMAMEGAYDPQFHFYQLAYGAIVLSFTGGIRWGITLLPNSIVTPDWRNLSYGIVPPLISLMSLMVTPIVGTISLMFAMTFSAYYESLIEGYPTWFKILKLWLTAIVVLSLSASSVCYFSLPDKEMKQFMDYNMQQLLK